MNVLIIGAGISGLLAAQSLQNAGLNVTVLDKGRGVGGRMATRRIGEAVIDHGAQFFTVRSDRFKALVEGWLADGLVNEWAQGWATPDGEWHNDGHPRYVGSRGMTTVPKHLAKDLDVRTRVRVATVDVDGEQLQITSEDGAIFTADALIMTPPIPQTVNLLQNGNVRMSSQDSQVLQRLGDYEPTLSVMAVLDGESNVPHPGGVKFFDTGSDIAWIADNTLKSISPNQRAVTIHATAAYSREHLGDDQQVVGEHLVKEAEPFLYSDVVEFQTHRWRYATPTEIYSDPCYVMDTPAPLILAGDVFNGPRIEGAALSGLAAADKLLELVGDASS